MLRLQSLNPIALTFFASLVLSAIAAQFEVTIAKDTAFYFDVAQTFNDHGLRATFARFDWPWMSILFAVAHSLTGLPWEAIGRLWTMLFMALACSLMVSVIARRVPGSVWWAVLVVLAMPAFNQYRGDIFREHGMWCFSVLALWLAASWDKQGGWLRAQAMHVAVLLAALFRLEAVVLMPALILWRLVEIKQPDGMLRLVQVAVLPALVGMAGLLAVLTLDATLTARLQWYLLNLLSPQKLFASFVQLEQQLGEMLRFGTVEDAGIIILFGFLATLIWKFIRLLGPFTVPFLFRGSWQAWRGYWQQFMPFTLAWVLYFGVMMVFFVQSLFVNGRYASYLNLLAVPLATLAAMTLAKRFPRAGKALVVAGVVVMLTNVISLSAKKTHYIDAARWLAQYAERTDDAYFDDYRMSWYAGWGFKHGSTTLPRAEALGEEHAASLRYYLIEAKPDAPWLAEWLARYPERRILAQFANRKGASVVIIGTCADAPTAPVCQTP